MDTGKNDPVLACPIIQSELKELPGLLYCLASLYLHCTEIGLREGIKIHFRYCFDDLFPPVIIVFVPSYSMRINPLCLRSQAYLVLVALEILSCPLPSFH